MNEWRSSSIGPSDRFIETAWVVDWDTWSYANLGAALNVECQDSGATVGHQLRLPQHGNRVVIGYLRQSRISFPLVPCEVSSALLQRSKGPSPLSLETDFPRFVSYWDGWQLLFNCLDLSWHSLGSYVLFFNSMLLLYSPVLIVVLLVLQVRDWETGIRCFVFFCHLVFTLDDCLDLIWFVVNSKTGKCYCSFVSFFFWQFFLTILLLQHLINIVCSLFIGRVWEVSVLYLRLS